MKLFPVDDRKHRQIQKKKELRQLQTKRDQLMDAGFINRAKATDLRITQLKKEIDSLDS